MRELFLPNKGVTEVLLRILAQQIGTGWYLIYSTFFGGGCLHLSVVQHCAVGQ